MQPLWVELLFFALSIIKAKQLIGKQTEGIKLDLSVMEDIMKLGLPYTIQRVSFICIGMVMARIIAGFGPTGIGVQKNWSTN